MTIGIPCNSCDNGSCGRCVAENLERVGFISDAKFHCKCANNGHSSDIKEKKLPHLKSMFGMKKEVDEPRIEVPVYEEEFE